MGFLSPWRLGLLALVALGLIAYIVVQRQRRTYALRFAASDLLDGLIPNQPSVRRHIPPALLLLSLATLIVGFAQPTRPTQIPRERATVMVAIDVSLSMEATDVEPNRIEAAQQAAITFVGELPPTLNVGVVAFSQSARVLVPPTTDRPAAVAAIENLTLSERTAIGEAIFTSLEAVSNSAPNLAGQDTPAIIVVLSDGMTTWGRPDGEAAIEAREAGVPVSTISFGTDTGVIIYDDPATPQIENAPVPVPVEESSLRTIAQGTGGTFFSASSLAELNLVYNDIGSAIGYDTETREITDWFVGAGVVLLVAAAGLNLLWYQRLP